MMKRIYNILCASAVAVLCISLAASCTDNITPNDPEEGIVLTVSTDGQALTEAATRAEMPGVDDWNENKIYSVYYFIYREGATDAAPVLKGFFAGLNLNGTTPKTWSIPVSSKTILEKLFPAGTHKCHVFVVANPVGDMVKFLEGDADNLTLDKIHRYCFFSSLEGIQNSFVMTYDGDVNLISRTGGSDRVVARIDAKLRRLAVKLSMHAKVVPEYNDPVSGKWIPEIDGMRITFRNGYSQTNLAGDYSSLTVKSSDYFDGAEAAFTNTRSCKVKNYDGDEVNGTISDSSIPLYSYPMKWEFADKYEPYMFIELPWTRYWTDINGNHQNTQSCFYKCMFSLKRVDANQWYDVTITLDALGSFNREEPIQQYLYEDYMVLNWAGAYSSGANVDADIKEARYLVVDQNDYVIYDQEALSIPYSASHECDIEVLSATQQNLMTGAYTDFSADAADWFTFSSTASVIEFKHTLNNTLGTGLDITPYDVSILVKHKDNPTYKQTVHILQYPSITVVRDLNSAVTANSSGQLTINDTKGHVYVNNTQPNDSNYGSVRGMTSTSGDNNCPYLHVINVRALSEENYVLKDPRVNSVDNLGTWNPTLASAPALYPNSSNRQMQNYYPSDSSTEAETSIAPKFMVASSFGKTLKVTYANAQRRCASYQEDGFPAGRWRLPTAAEVRFCVSLSYYGKIQSLFATDSNYWCASGYATASGGSVTVTSTYTSSTTCYARCVYDTWYWEEIDRQAGRTGDRPAPTTTFTWGDQPR